MMKHVGAIVAELVTTKFGNNQTRAAKALDCSQSHISAMVTGVRGPGLNTLLALRDYTGRSIDDLLGLDTTPGDALVRELRETVEAHLQARLKVAETIMAGHDEAEQALREKREREQGRIRKLAERRKAKQ